MVLTLTSLLWDWLHCRYVLQDFSKKEQEAIDLAVYESVDLIRKVMAQGVEATLGTAAAK